MPCRIGRRTVNLARILAGEGSAAVRTLASVGVHDDLSASQAGVAGGTADHELAGRIDMQDEIVLEQGCGLRIQRRLESWQQNIPDVGLYPVVHRLVHLVLTELANRLRICDIPEFLCHEVVVLG